MLPEIKKDIENTNLLLWEDVVARDRRIIDRICNDDNFSYYFIYVTCKPLLSKIMWTIFKNETDYEEIANELYVYLKQPDKNGELWHNLKTFDHRTSLFDWIKIVSIRLFLKQDTTHYIISKELKESGILPEVALKLTKAIDRKLLKLYIFDEQPIEEICKHLDIEQSQFNNLYNLLKRKIANIIRNDYPEFFPLMQEGRILQKTDEETPEQPTSRIENKMDLERLIAMIPNNRYKMVLNYLYIEDKKPEDAAKILKTPISNIYNLRVRAIDQLRDIAILSNEILMVKKYISSLSSDILREFTSSLLLKGQSYENIIQEFSLSQAEFKELKKQMLFELKQIIYRKK